VGIQGSCKLTFLYCETVGIKQSVVPTKPLCLSTVPWRPWHKMDMNGQL